MNWTLYEWDAPVAGDAGAGFARRARHRHLVARALTSERSASAPEGFCYSSPMQTATGATEGHIVALIAVGSCAVADVDCCR
ncbi:Ms4533A family Cys-rich leader peptide [Mycobacterium sp. 852013-50091_SCH5140682]|uniref:Ms4533A family Cys-rich leader peptide n=1 Tax=Mycobacterium sp. 852013-50091_SCH5140682 TaxID=1834109 RepID=UPI00336BBC3E